jgi:hypothetical protein
MASAVALQPEKQLGVATVVAVQHVRRMRGGAQAHLMRCSDGYFYVVKFQNNPQHLRVLANEMLAALLARLVGLPVPEPAIVDVSGWLVEHSPEMNICLTHTVVPCQSGLQFGSRYLVATPWDGLVLDYLPVKMLDRLRNLHTFAGMLALDKWTGNTDGRQAVFSRRTRKQRYTATFIDQGYCFNGGEWTFPDNPLQGLYMHHQVYLGVTGWESFEPWLSRIGDMTISVITAAAEEIPECWYRGDSNGLSCLARTMQERSGKVRNLVAALRLSSGQPFPNWGKELPRHSL